MRSALAAVQNVSSVPRFLMSTPASLKCYEPEQYAQITAARRQWENLRIVLNEQGADVEIFEKNGTSKPAVTEVGSTALIHQNTAYVPRDLSLRGIVRRQFIEQWANQTGFRITYMPGAPNSRNMVKMNESHVIVNRGKQLLPSPQDLNVDHITAVQMKVLHQKLQTLDTVLCPLTDNLALLVPDAFDRPTVSGLGQLFDFIQVPIEEAKLFVCNSIVLGDRVILPAGCDQTAQKLAEYGFTPVFVGVSKLGGGPLKYALRIE